MSYEFEGFTQQGWQCPICKRIYSPFTPMCWYCGGNQQTIVSTTGTSINPGFVIPTNELESTKTINKQE